MDTQNGKLFDRKLYRLRRHRAASGWAGFDFLKREAAAHLADRLSDVTQDFPLAVDLGCHRGEVAQALTKRVRMIIGCDGVEAMSPQIICDEEFLPFAHNSVDLVVSALSLHHVNDLPGTLIQIHACLRPGGLFVAVLPGANTLKELRASVTGAAATHNFPLSPRVSSFVDVRDAGSLLQRAGFALPVADSDTLIIDYDTPLQLMQDLHGMGESNVLLAQRRHFTPRSHWAAILEYYTTHSGDEQGTVPATIEFVTMMGWKEDI